MNQSQRWTSQFPGILCFPEFRDILDKNCVISLMQIASAFVSMLVREFHTKPFLNILLHFIIYLLPMDLMHNVNPTLALINYYLLQSWSSVIEIYSFFRTKLWQKKFRATRQKMWIGVWPMHLKWEPRVSRKICYRLTEHLSAEGLIQTYTCGLWPTAKIPIFSQSLLLWF